MDTLRDIATIHLGYSVRSGAKDTTTSDRRVIQMKDAWPDKIDQTLDFDRIYINKLPAHFPVRVGDLIFRPRGNHTITVLIKDIMPFTVCSAPLMLIRVRSQEKVLPAYLNWFINSPRTQAVLDGYATRDKDRKISLTAIAGLDVLVPPLCAQHHIIAEDAKLQQFIREHVAILNQSQAKLDDYLWEHATAYLAQPGRCRA